MSDHSLVHWYQQCVTVHCSDKHRRSRGVHCFLNYIYILRPSCFCENWALCVSWITYDHIYYSPCFACWSLFGSLVPAVSNRTSCAHVHELPQSHCGDNWEGTLFSWLNIYYTHLASVKFEHCVSWSTYDHLYYTPC